MSSEVYFSVKVPNNIEVQGPGHTYSIGVSLQPCCISGVKCLNASHLVQKLSCGQAWHQGGSYQWRYRMTMGSGSRSSIFSSGLHPPPHMIYMLCKFGECSVICSSGEAVTDRPRDRQMNGRMDWQIDGWTDIQMDTQTDAGDDNTSMVVAPRCKTQLINQTAIDSYHCMSFWMGPLYPYTVWHKLQELVVVNGQIGRANTETGATRQKHMEKRLSSSIHLSNECHEQ